ncbi:MAG: hypothetical protein A2Z94_05925 [Gallionellales bacterium GWA2_55_18]|nr:MAG: hypothetical protein A2Z94_05925 [Gallionellales bacterium GWA2_55_18]
MPELNRQTQPAVQRRLITNLAHSEAEVLEAQRLHYKVFTEEMGANLPGASIEIDRYVKRFLKISEQFLKISPGKPRLNG